eukprot:1393253-Amorphochlora_amoeboformis.AAC.1
MKKAVKALAKTYCIPYPRPSVSFHTPIPLCPTIDLLMFPETVPKPRRNFVFPDVVGNGYGTKFLRHVFRQRGGSERAKERLLEIERARNGKREGERKSRSSQRVSKRGVRQRRGLHICEKSRCEEESEKERE